MAAASHRPSRESATTAAHRPVKLMRSALGTWERAWAWAWASRRASRDYGKQEGEEVQKKE